MTAAITTISEPTLQPNSPTAIAARLAAGRISRIGPILLVAARSVLLVVVQGLMALLLLALHRPSPWRSAGDWWAVYGTLVDLGCLLGLRFFTRREGIRMRDLIGPIRLRWGRDVFLGLGYFIIVFPFFVGASFPARMLLYRSAQDANAYLIHGHALPLWAIVYSLTAWWIIWSPTEETTYQAYVLPRLEALTGRTWIAFAIVGFCWAAQHCALPLVLDWRFMCFRFLTFLPGVLVFMVIYLRTRRLAPLIVAHWPMDIAASLMTAIY